MSVSKLGRCEHGVEFPECRRARDEAIIVATLVRFGVDPNMCNQTDIRSIIAAAEQETS